MSTTLPRPELRHRLVRLAEAATTPLLPADYLDLFAPLRSGAELRARVVEVRPETADAATIVLKPGADWAGHVPGQYVRIGIDVDGVRQWRAYSLTHGPRRDGLISITVKAVPDGVVSPHLVHRVRPGTLVHLEQAAGEFVLPRLPGKLLFITAGSGITPVIGMLRNLFPVTDEGVLRWGATSAGAAPARGSSARSAAAAPARGSSARSEGAAPARGSSARSEGAGVSRPDDDIVVVHVAPTRPQSIFREHLELLDANGAIRLVARYDDEHGVLDVDDLAQLVPDLAERTTYACGPGGLLDAVGAHHERRGLELFTEQFRPSFITPGEGGSVTFIGSDVTVEADGATPLLEAGEAGGVLMPSGCRMGVCFGCVVPLREGAVRDLRSGDITIAVPGETGDEGVPIQTCISAAAGPCRIEI